MFARLERTIWPVTVPLEVNVRRLHLAHDFSRMKRSGLFPERPDNILDMGSGSGAGSVALKDVYPASHITALDNAQNWQTDSLYHRRKPPSDITFIPAGIEEFDARNKDTFDLIVAARISWDFPIDITMPWIFKAHAIEKRLLTVLHNLGQNGSLVMSWPRKEAGKFIRIVKENIQMDGLFQSTDSWKGSDDKWVVWREFRRDKLDSYISHPDELLTTFAKSCNALDPHGLYGD